MFVVAQPAHCIYARRHFSVHSAWGTLGEDASDAARTRERTPGWYAESKIGHKRVGVDDDVDSYGSPLSASA